MHVFFYQLITRSNSLPETNRFSCFSWEQTSRITYSSPWSYFFPYHYSVIKQQPLVDKASSLSMLHDYTQTHHTK